MIGDERGITLVELLVVLAITALITGTLVTAIYQIYQVTGWGNRELVVQHDLQNAATWLNRDVVSASGAEITGPRMVLTIPTSIIDTINITYTYSEAEGTLTRYSGGSSLIVARHVDSVDFSPTAGTSAITITLTSRASDVTQSATWHLDMRPEPTPSP
jgi:Tfp pilus assembly protein PilE